MARGKLSALLDRTKKERQMRSAKSRTKLSARWVEEVFDAATAYVIASNSFATAAAHPDLTYEVDEVLHISDGYAYMYMTWNNLLDRVFEDSGRWQALAREIERSYPPGTPAIKFDWNDYSSTALNAILSFGLSESSWFGWQLTRRFAVTSYNYAKDSRYTQLLEEWNSVRADIIRGTIQRSNSRHLDFNYLGLMLHRERIAVLDGAKSRGVAQRASAATRSNWIPEELQQRAQIAKLSETQRGILRAICTASSKAEGLTLRELVTTTRANNSSTVERAIKAMRTLGIHITNERNGAGYCLGGKSLGLGHVLVKLDAETTPKRR